MAGEQLRVLIKIPATATRGEYNDAIHYDPVAYAAMTEAQKQADVQARYTAWTAHIDRQNAINRDPAVIALRNAEAATAKATQVRETLAGADSDAVLANIITVVVAGARTPADVRARLVSLTATPPGPGPFVPGPVVTAPPSPTTPTMPGGMGMP